MDNMTTDRDETPDQDPSLDLWTMMIMGAVTVVSFTLMALGVVKLGELVRLVPF